ncbi:MAG: hypothetical protein K1X31_07320 [Gemmatimonadaceae bacterium]|nr:hypothetical protein [Gemmatimonadaceae bacterium]
MRRDRPPQHEVALTLPGWVSQHVDYDEPYPSDEARIGLVLSLARENERLGTGAPSAAAVFEAGTGRLVAVGVESVRRLNNSTAHAALLALQFAERRLVHHALAAVGQPAHELFTSAAPCPMCRAAADGSGVSRLVSAAGGAPYDG